MKPIANHTDDELVNLILGTDEDSRSDATEALLGSSGRYGPLLKKYAKGHRDQFCDLQVKILSRLHTFNPKKSRFARWVQMVVKGRAVEAIRKKKRSPREISGEDGEAIMGAAEAAPRREWKAASYEEVEKSALHGDASALEELKERGMDIVDRITSGDQEEWKRLKRRGASETDARAVLDADRARRGATPQSTRSERIPPESKLVTYVKRLSGESDAAVNRRVVDALFNSEAVRLAGGPDRVLVASFLESIDVLREKTRWRERPNSPVGILRSAADAETVVADRMEPQSPLAEQIPGLLEKAGPQALFAPSVAGTLSVLWRRAVEGDSEARKLLRGVGRFLALETPRTAAERKRRRVAQFDRDEVGRATHKDMKEALKKASARAGKMLPVVKRLTQKPVSGSGHRMRKKRRADKARARD